MQADFFLTQQTKQCDISELWMIEGEDHTFITYRRSDRPTNKSTLSIDVPMYLTSHFQFYEDQTTQRLNELARKIDYLDCLQDRGQQERLNLLSLSSPLLAAQSSGYPTCRGLQAYGNIAVLYVCKQQTFDFQPFLTSCGYEPMSTKRNMSLHHDGLQLRPFSPCYWRNSRVLFGTQLYTVSNQSWVKVVPTHDAVHVHLHTKFNATIDHGSHFLSLSRERSQLSLLHMMGEVNEMMVAGRVASMDPLVKSIQEKAPVYPNFGAYLRRIAITVVY